MLHSYEVKSKSKKSLSRVRLCDPVDCSLPGSSAHGILQARILEWVAISFSRGEVTSSLLMKERNVSKIREWHRPLTDKMYFEIIFAPGESSRAIK